MPDSQPTYLQANSNGDVQAVFPGGVQMLAGDDDTPPNERRIRWVREADGTLVADISAYNNGILNEVRMRSVENLASFISVLGLSTETLTRSASVNLQSTSAPATPGAEINVSASDTATGDFANARVIKHDGTTQWLNIRDAYFNEGTEAITGGTRELLVNGITNWDPGNHETLGGGGYEVPNTGMMVLIFAWGEYQNANTNRVCDIRTGVNFASKITMCRIVTGGLAGQSPTMFGWRLRGPFTAGDVIDWDSDHSEAGVSRNLAFRIGCIPFMLPH